MNAFTREERALIAERSAVIIGVGGLGGYAANGLARLGIGRLTLIDGDTFDETNLDRQLYADRTTLGRSKAETAAEKLRLIGCSVEARFSRLDGDNALSLLACHDIALDCTDNAEARLALGRACRKLRLPLIHAAVGGLCCQIAAVEPESRLLERLYGASEARRASEPSPVFAVELAASLQCAEAAKLLAGRAPSYGRMLLIDLERMTFDTVSV